MGSNGTIINQITIPTRSGRHGQASGLPKLGNRVRIMPGAKVLGGVTVGDDAVIRANAVVTKDFPAGAVVAGNPARTIRVTDRQTTE